MEEQRARGRAGRATVGDGGESSAGDLGAEAVAAFARANGSETRFTGYETERQHTTIASAEHVSGRTWLLKLPEFAVLPCRRWPGRRRWHDRMRARGLPGARHARVPPRRRQGLAAEFTEGGPDVGEPVLARVDHLARHATEANHTATHLLHAALRQRLGSHVRQAGSYVGPDKLRFDFSHGHALSPEELRDVEDRVNEWIARNDPVRPITTTLDEARRLGAMALFGEKYGDVVRMVEIGAGEYSRELCGGTHVRSTAEIGAFRIVSETSSAANVRRIEALTGPEAVALLRAHDGQLTEISAELRTTPERAPAAVRALVESRKKLEKAVRDGSGPAAAADVEELAGRAGELAGVRVLAASAEAPDAKALLEFADRVKGRLGDAAILLAPPWTAASDLVASVAPAVVERGVKAGSVVKAAAAVVSGGRGPRHDGPGRRPRSRPTRGGDRGRTLGDRRGARRLMARKATRRRPGRFG